MEEGLNRVVSQPTEAGAAEEAGESIRLAQQATATAAIATIYVIM